MRTNSVKEYAKAVRERHRGASRVGNGKILDEFTPVTGHHRKFAIRHLSGQTGAAGKRRGRQVWKAAGGSCGKRLEPFMPELVAKLQEEEEIRITTQLGERSCGMSASTIDRLLKPYKVRGLRRPMSTTKPRSLLKAAIPIRTFIEWNEGQPGFVEVDLVAHCGESAEGFISTP